MTKFYLMTALFEPFADGHHKYAAASKAPADVVTILKENYDVEEKIVSRRCRNKFVGSLEFIVNFLIKLRQIPKGETIFIQYPMVNVSVFHYCIKFLRGYKSIMMVHDLPTYRFEDQKSKRSNELSILNSFEYVIVHSESMKLQLERDGVISKMIVLGAFDYLLPKNQVSKKELNTIVFAGALHKSMYLKDLHKVPQQNIHFNLYGAQKPEITYLPSINYKGRFAPSDVSTIEGDWGLMWDGEGIDSCGGKFGDYLHLIAPHKFSLYIACGLKVIIWEESAMAPLVKEKKLGITIRRLNEIEEKISSLTDEEKAIIERNVAEMSKSIRRGDMLKIALNKLY